MGIETLRQLVQDHARGKIDRLQYRQQRSILIDEITETTEDEQPEPVEAPQSPSTDTNNHSPEIAIKPGSINIKIALAVAALITVILLVIFLSGNADPVEKQANTSAEIAITNPENSIRTFIEYDNWSSERVSQFVADWQNLPEQQKQQVKQAEVFQSLVTEMSKRLDEQQLLAKSGSQDAHQQAQSIKSLAILLNVAL